MDCEICMETKTGYVSICGNSHNICLQCYENIKLFNGSKCPSCRQESEIIESDLLYIAFQNTIKDIKNIITATMESTRYYEIHTSVYCSNNKRYNTHLQGVPQAYIEKIIEVQRKHLTESLLVKVQDEYNGDHVKSSVKAYSEIVTVTLEHDYGKYSYSFDILSSGDDPA